MMRRSHSSTTGHRPRTTDRRGFTLIELLVVVSILLLVSLTTVFLITSTLDSDRTRSAARQLQSAFAGARDRALHAREIRGVRLIRENPLGLDGKPGRAGFDDNGNGTTDDNGEIGWIGSDDYNLVTKMVYIGPGGQWRQGIVRLGRFDFNDDGIAEAPEVRVVRGVNTGWKKLFDRGLLVTGSRIQIPANSGSWYTIDTTMLRNSNYVQNRPEQLILTSEYLNPTTEPYFGGTGTRPPGQVPQGPDAQWGIANQDDNGDGTVDDANERFWPHPPNDDSTDIHAFPALLPDASGVADYILQLEPTPLPNQEPMELPRNVVLDLMLTSKAPGHHLNQTRKYPSTLLSRPDRIDIMFSPRGAVTGPASAGGLIHFLIRDVEDVTKYPEDPLDSEREQLVLSIFTKTGRVSTHPVGTVYGPDFWVYAETGRVAGQ